MKTHRRLRTRARPTSEPTPARPRSKYGYDHRWWGEPADVAVAAIPEGSYWLATRRPLPCLAFILPILLVYEVGVARLGGPAADALRAGADAWMRRGLTSLGLTDRLLPPLALTTALLTWQAIDARRWKFRPGVLVGMLVESLVLGVALVGLSKMVDVGFDRLDDGRLLQTGSPHLAAPLIGFLGAGLYEEALFRLALMPAIYFGLRLLQAPSLAANTVAVTGSALLFSLAHHAGSPGEAFTWYAFIFRWLAGVFFAWVFAARGFGVAVGTHSAYDILVGWLDLRF